MKATLDEIKGTHWPEKKDIVSKAVRSFMDKHGLRWEGEKGGAGSALLEFFMLEMISDIYSDLIAEVERLREAVKELSAEYAREFATDVAAWINAGELGDDWQEVADKLRAYADALEASGPKAAEEKP